jgi:phosphoribosylformimino-5-aminoimidazole carboxamide ribotide isomerase
MQCVPVIDLLGGWVVHAVRGQRDDYRPLVTPFATRATASDVLAGLRGFHAFRSCYIADLSVIRQTGDHDHEIGALLTQHPDLEFWVDAAFGSRTVMPPYAGAANVRLVIGSESLPDLPAWHATRARCTGRHPPLLSLDHHQGRGLGPEVLARTPTMWPQRVIAMNLDHVGSGLGPDFALLARLSTMAPATHLIAAGGVRDRADLMRLKENGVSAVLLASALHRGALTTADLAEVERTEP